MSFDCVMSDNAVRRFVAQKSPALLDYPSGGFVSEVAVEARRYWVFVAPRGPRMGGEAI
jgi:hypothetical protein